MFLTTGDPDTGHSLREVADELAYAIGRHLDRDKAAPSKPDTVVLDVVAVAPWRGTVANRVSFKRSRAEFWSSHNIDFSAYVAGDARGKLEAMCKALIGAANQVPDK